MVAVTDDAFDRLIYLTSLKITRTGMIEIPKLKSLVRLTTLDLSNNTIKYADEKRLPTKLNKLFLDGNRLVFIRGLVIDLKEKLYIFTALILDN